MGLYRALRPLVFAAPPEAAHRVAGSLLELPLPWRRIGGPVDDPSLSTELAGIPLRNPIGLAAGFDKRCRVLHSLGLLGFGYVVGGTITSRPREGNPRPRIARYPGRDAMVNSMGLPNPGPEAAASNLRRWPRTAPRFVSLADEDLPDVLRSLALLEPSADGIELNASCPNVSWGRDRDTERHLAELVGELTRRTVKPVIVKLPPFATASEREAVTALAGVAAEAGVAGLTCSNTRPVGDHRQAVGRGGLSGRPLFEGTLEAVRAVREATGGDLPVNACGGVFSAEDALACLEAGAATVQVYTALVFEGPRLLRRLTQGLAAARRGREPAPALTPVA